MMENQIVKITCGKEKGTAFYVTENLLLTAEHVVDDYDKSNKNVIIHNELGELTFEVMFKWIDKDIALIKVERSHNDSVQSLFSHRLRVNEDFEAFGFPNTASEHGKHINGYVKEPLYGEVANFTLNTIDADIHTNYEGMSGAPVVQNGKIVGVVIEQCGRDLNIVSVHAIESILREAGIPIEIEISLSSIPPSIQRDVELSMPNYDVFDKLDQRISTTCRDWVLLYGTPGSGKTTISAGYEPNNSSIKVLGRFFFKVPSDTKSRAERCSEGFFVDWLESVYITESGNELKKISLSEKRGSIENWLSELDRLLSNDNKIGVIIIDGLDELVDGNNNRVNDILFLFPTTLPDNIKIVLSCISEEIIPSSIIENLTDENKIQVNPLQMAACEAYIKKNSGEWKKPYSLIQSVASKTEGHPLYMNYSCRYIAQNFNSSTKKEVFNEWIESLPSIGGDIKSYYNAVWKKINNKSQVYEILSVLSQTRGSVDEEQLVNMLSNQDVYSFYANIREFRHLLKEQESDVYEIYHSSFRLYIAEKLKLTLKNTNDQIALYCDTHRDTLYSIENYLHHVVNGSDVNKGLKMCNQDWADNCALNDVSPDLILYDIKECLSFAVDLSMPLDVIRLMLLAQRIEFRCDSVMVENVFELVEMNIALGKPDVALKYLIRDNILLVQPEIAIYFLRVLFNLGYNEVALQLADSMEATVRRELYNAEEKKISIGTLFLKSVILVERMIAGLDDTRHLYRFYCLLIKLKEGCDQESLNGIDGVIKYVSNYQIVRKIQSGNKININKDLEKHGVVWNNDVVILYVKALASINSMDTALCRSVKNEAYYDCVNQIEDAIINNDLHFEQEDYSFILYILMCDSYSVNAFSSLIAEYNYQVEPLNVRKANGVDVNYKSLETFFNENEYKGFVDIHDSNVPAIHRYDVNAADWERYIESLVIKIAYIRGRLYRYKKDNQNCSVCYQLVVDVLNDIDFTFKSRASWNRSYLIPEEIFPYVYTKLTEIYRDFFPTKIQDLVHHIISRKDSQLSLYKEGYTNTLIDMFESLVGFHNLYDTANFLGDEAVKYVLNAVQNRSERCNFLLILCKLFAIIGDKDKSRVIYREILKSSMGPDWYKEAQLDLINGFGFFDIKLNNSQTAHFAAIFEEASGEMTFQRYVQQQKNQFVGTIAKVSSVRDAISYYKYETLPSSDVIISNAESWKVDMPTLGDGYDLGANHLIESSAICYLLLSCDAASPYIRYALNELFWENWDKIHNDQSYAKLHSKILMAMTEKDAINNILPRMAHYYVNEYNGTDRSNYLNYLEQADISESILCNFKLCLDNVGELWERCGKKEKENTDDKLRDRLNRYSSSKEVLTEMRQNIISPLGNYWSSLSDFFVPLVEKADFDSKNLFDVIVEHYNINVQPSTSQFKKFSWFQGAHDENDENNQLVRFLIWFLVHPENKISTRAHDALQWLFQFEEEEVLCSLTKEIMSPTDYGLDTKASEFLLDLTRLSPIAIRNFMNDEQFLKLSTISKFSISRNLYEIALIIFQTLRDESMLNIMKEIIPDELEDRGDVLIEEKDSLLIYHKIEGLNNLRLTGGKDFAIPYMAEWEKCFACGLVEKMIKSDRYIRRSFYLNYYTKQRYDRMMTNVLDLILYRKVDYKRAGKAYSAINN